MKYTHNGGVAQGLSKTSIIALAVGFALTLVLSVFSFADAAKKTPPTNAGSLGQVTLDTDVFASSEVEMDYGDGISNGEWIVAEMQGVQLAARITDRTDGTLDVSGDRGNRVGVYEANTGTDGATALAEWNYEWSVDLSNAKGNAKNKTVDDYTLTLEQDFTSESLYGALGSDPVSLPMPAVCDASSTTLCQQSWNPTFGNSDFDFNEVREYNFRFVLTPKTFNGPTIAVVAKVVVSVDVTGDWLLDFASGNDNRRFVDLEQDEDGNVTGDFEYLSGSTWSYGGTLEGNVSGDTLSLHYERPASFNYTGDFVGTVEGDSIVDGSFTDSNGGAYSWTAVR